MVCIEMAMKLRAKVAQGRRQDDEFKERLAWCRSTFGTESHERWMPKHCYEFRFADEKDYMLFVLRWS